MTVVSSRRFVPGERESERPIEIVASSKERSISVGTESPSDQVSNDCNSGLKIGGAGNVILIEAPSGSVGRHMQSPVVTVSPGDSLAKAVVRLTSRRLGCLPVVEDETLVGILTETDILEAFLRALRDETISADADQPVSCHMTRDPLAVDGGMSATRALDLMRQKRFRHLPVMEGNKVAGVVSLRDVLSTRIRRS